MGLCWRQTGECRTVRRLRAFRGAGSSKPKRVKRTEAQMIASLGGSALKEANYIADRIAKFEDKISELMSAVGQPARELILKDHPHLARY